MNRNDIPSQKNLLTIPQLFISRLSSVLRKQSFLTIILLAAVLAILFYQSLFCGRGLLPSDAILQVVPWSLTSNSTLSNYLLSDQYNVFIPQHEFVYHEINKGSFPLWNPHLCCGMPNLASIQGALLFPIQLALSPIDPFHASGIAAFLKLFLAGFFTMLYMRRIGASHIAALLSGLIFSLGGSMIVWLGHPQVNSAMWLPLLLYFIEGHFDLDRQGDARVSLRNWIGFAVAYGCTLLGGHPPTAIHVMLLVSCYFIFRLAGNDSRTCIRSTLLMLCALLAGILLASPQLLPYVEYYNLSSSGLSSHYLNRWQNHLSIDNLIHFLLPFASGSPVAGFEDLPHLLGLDDIQNFNERTGYVGILPLLLASCAVLYRRCKFSYFYLTTAVISMLIVLGTPPFPFIIHKIPVLQDINHTRLLLLVSFSLAVMAGLGADTLSNTKSRRRIVILVASFWLVMGFILIGFFSSIYQNIRSLDTEHTLFLLRQLSLLAGGLIASVIIILRPKHKWPFFVGIVCLAWTTFDLCWFAEGYNPNISADRHYPSAKVVEFLKKDPSLFRIAGIGDILGHNTASVYGLYDIRGTDFMSVKRYEQLVTGTAGDFDFYTFAKSLPPMFPLLNVKYIITSAPGEVDSSIFELVYWNEVAVYKYKPFLDRAVVVFDYKVFHDPEDILSIVRRESFRPREVLLLEEEPTIGNVSQSAPDSKSAVRFVKYQPDDIVIEASLPRPGFLLLLDTYFPGWQATVNNRAARIYRADYNFRAVSLPAGESVVCFSYGPESLRIGFVLSFSCILLLVIGWFARFAPGKPALRVHAEGNKADKELHED